MIRNILFIITSFFVFGSAVSGGYYYTEVQRLKNITDTKSVIPPSQVEQKLVIYQNKLNAEQKAAEALQNQLTRRTRDLKQAQLQIKQLQKKLETSSAQAKDTEVKGQRVALLSENKALQVKVTGLREKLSIIQQRNKTLEASLLLAEKKNITADLSEQNAQPNQKFAALNATGTTQTLTDETAPARITKIAEEKPKPKTPPSSLQEKTERPVSKKQIAKRNQDNARTPEQKSLKRQDMRTSASQQLSTENPDLIRALQKHLKTAGCYPGHIDGVWGQVSAYSLATFSEHAQLGTIYNTPAKDVLNILKTYTARVCPAGTENKIVRHFTQGPPKTKQDPSMTHMNSQTVHAVPVDPDEILDKLAR